MSLIGNVGRWHGSTDGAESILIRAIEEQEKELLKAMHELQISKKNVWKIRDKIKWLKNKLDLLKQGPK